MCSNYRPATGRELARFDVLPPAALDAGKDAFPGSLAPVILGPGDARRCVAATFGLLPFWAKDRNLARRTYNARTETVADKPAYRNAWQKRQLCIVPAAAIYEPCYETGKAVWWRIQRTDGQPMALAGLWERRGEDDWSFTMLTVNADTQPVMRRFHKPNEAKRTVVVLEAETIDAWLGAGDEAAMRALLMPCAGDALRAEPGRLD